MPIGTSAERALWRAHLVSWVRDACGFVVAESDLLERARVTARAREWIFADAAGPGSWRWTCELLGLDPAWLAAKVLSRRPLEVAPRKVDIRTVREIAAA